MGGYFYEGEGEFHTRVHPQGIRWNSNEEEIIHARQENPMKDGPFIIGPSPHVQNPTHVGTSKPLNPITVDLNLY
jgi:hypothetical protein